MSESFFNRARPPIIGMIHLSALPGSPRRQDSIQEIEARALAESSVLHGAGVTGLMIENFGDVPFFKDGVEPHTIAIMTRIALKIKATTGLPLGINVLRNDVRAALGIAQAVDAAFVRVNVHVGAMVTDQGMIEGTAAQTLRYRRQLGLNTMILADVAVKHATQVGSATLEEMARDAFWRGLADALIVSGSGTGLPTDPKTLQRVRAAVPNCPIIIGSGLNIENLPELLPLADGAIVGTTFKLESNPNNPVDPRRVSAFMEAYHHLYAGSG